MKFSERKGYKKVSTDLQVEGMTQELRNNLWNDLDMVIWQSNNFIYNRYGKPGIVAFANALWFRVFKKPIDQIPETPRTILSEIRTYYFSITWHEVYDFLEFVIDYHKKAEEFSELSKWINRVLNTELAGYRFVNGICTEITDKKEIEALEEALNDPDFPGVQTHLKAALELMSNREKPDYRNSIKESISAVESIAQKITGQAKATLGDALKVLEKKHNLHPALKKGFESIYGYTSDGGGIRHAMQENPNLNAHDAKFFLLSCTSFINYLKTKI